MAESWTPASQHLSENHGEGRIRLGAEGGKMNFALVQARVQRRSWPIPRATGSPRAEGLADALGA